MSPPWSSMRIVPGEFAQSYGCRCMECGRAHVRHSAGDDDLVFGIPKGPMADPMLLPGAATWRRPVSYPELCARPGSFWSKMYERDKIIMPPEAVELVEAEKAKRNPKVSMVIPTMEEVVEASRKADEERRANAYKASSTAPNDIKMPDMTKPDDEAKDIRKMVDQLLQNTIKPTLDVDVSLAKRDIEDVVHRMEPETLLERYAATVGTLPTPLPDRTEQERVVAAALLGEPIA
jgi:hypothetical protein